MTRFSNRQLSRIAMIGASLAVVMLAHWWTPTGPHSWHLVHLILRKLFFVPVVLAAVWFDFRGAFFAALAVTVLYLPHVFLQWAGHYAENMNQIGELATVWLAAGVAGSLVALEKNALRSLAKTREGALVALVSALDAREHNTQLHSLRVRAYALRLGRELRMPEHDLRILGEAALLHDVGKIGVQDHILLKPESLTDDEWRMMREHPLIGKRILEPVDFLTEAAEIVYAHHEKFDGSGYPRGLAEEKIPLGARVFAVADALDALVTDRPYQHEIALGEAMERILAGSGSHFDPRVVQAFSSIPEEQWEDITKGVEWRRPS